MRLQRLGEAGPTVLAWGLAAGRLAIGLAALGSPEALTRRALRGGRLADESVTLARMAAGRDVALGLGALLASRRGPQALRGWLEAGALADAVDAAVFAGGHGLRLPARLGGSLLAAAAALLGARTARRLSG
ncbi:MAG TPA: hypothetical protein VG452_00200 [Egibacteraceae bacterium]|nr:hypothetical protein [Egibacteraceae bacterium]